MANIYVPSPAVSVVGRHNSGKTTLIERIIAKLVERKHDVGSIKHHSHVGFDIDYPGKDSYRHRQAGASETVIASPDMLARVRTMTGEIECSDILKTMPGHDIVIVEGYRKSGLPTIEIMRAGNQADTVVARAFVEGAKNGWTLGTDFTQVAKRLYGSDAGSSLQSDTDSHSDRDSDSNSNSDSGFKSDFASEPNSDSNSSLDDVSKSGGDYHPAADISNKMPTSSTVAVVTDIPEAIEAARIFGIPSFDINDIDGIVAFLEEHYVRPRISVVIQAGGESRRMGQSKSTVPFGGRPLICRLIDRLSPVADELIITTNEGERLEFLHSEYPELKIKLVPDLFDFRGALPGLYSALVSAENSFVAVVACDMVFASARLVVAESLAMAHHGADVVVPVNKHGFEPFHAMYRRDTCIPAIRRAIDKGELRAQAFFDDSEVYVYEFSQDQVLEVEPRGGCFINANTPEELKRIEDSYLGE